MSKMQAGGNGFSSTQRVPIWYVSNNLGREAWGHKTLGQSFSIYFFGGNPTFLFVSREKSMKSERQDNLGLTEKIEENVSDDSLLACSTSINTLYRL